MMRLLTVIFALAVFTEATAQTRPMSPAISCAQASRLVTTQGAVVLGTGTYTYDRYVSGAGFCAPGEAPEPAWVPSADSAQCFVGYRCRGTSQRQSNR
jgi:hypothetical protein